MKDILHEFLKYEHENELFGLEIQDIKYWSFIRFNLYHEIEKQLKGIGDVSSASNKNLPNLIRSKLKQIPNFLFRNPLFMLKKRDIIVLNSPRRVKNDNYYECIYTDELLRNINHTYYVFEEPYLGNHFQPVCTNNLRYTDYIIFISALKKVLLKKLGILYFTEEEKLSISNLVTNLNNKFKTNLNISSAIKLIEDCIWSYKYRQKYYERILDKVQPKVVLEVCSYGYEVAVINSIAKKKGIKVIEFQHGFIGSYHIAYNFFNKICLDTFPDYIFLFGEYWKNTTSFPIKDTNILITGFPYFEKKVKSLRSIQSQNKKIMLFISDGQVTGEKLSKLACDLNNLLNHDIYKIIYKFHPKEYEVWRQLYPWLIESGIEVIDNSEHDIYHYLSIASYQIGIYSTAIIEGLGFNLKTFIYKDNYGYKFMKDLYLNGHALLVSSPEEILNNLSINQEITDTLVHQFWMNKSIENMNRYIDQIINS